MAKRQDVQLDLPGIEVTPAAQPVDTYYRTNLPKPADMVDNAGLQIGRALAALSPSLKGFLKWQEEGRRDFDDTAAQQSAKDLSDEQLKRMGEWTVEEWNAFGDHGGRPTFQLAMQVYGNRRIAKNMVGDIVADWNALKTDLFDPLKTPDIPAMISELGDKYRDMFEGHYARQGADSVLSPLFDELQSASEQGRSKALDEHQEANYTQSASDIYGEFFLLQGDDAAPSPQTLTGGTFKKLPTSHPFVLNEDGSKSNVILEVGGVDGMFIVYPTLVGGKKLPGVSGWQVATHHGLENYPAFKTQGEAVAFAEKNHEYFSEDGTFTPPADKLRSPERLEERLQVEAGAMPNKTEAERLVLLQNALGYRAMEIVASDPVEGLEQALELLDMAGEGLGPGGKALFPPGTKHAGTLDNLRSEARSVARQQEYASRNDAPELINGLTAQFVLDNPEATKDEIEAFQNGPFADALRADGQTELEVSAAKLDFMQFATANVSDLDPDVLLDAQLRSHVNEITVPEILALAKSGDITYESASRLISTVEGKLKASDLGSGVNRGATSAIANNAGKILLGFPDDLLVEEKDQSELRKISTQFRAAFAAALDVAGDDPTKVAEVLKNFEEGGSEALRFSKKLDSLKSKRSDMTVDKLVARPDIQRAYRKIAGAFMASLSQYALDPSANLMLEAKLAESVKVEAEGILDAEVAKGNVDPSLIATEIERTFNENGEKYLKGMETETNKAVRLQADKAKRIDVTGVMVENISGVAFTDDDLDTGFFTGGTNKNDLDLGDILDDSAARRKKPLDKPAIDWLRESQTTEEVYFMDKMLGALTAFTEGKAVSTSSVNAVVESIAGKKSPNPAIGDVSPTSIEIDEIKLDMQEAKNLLNTLRGLRGINSETILRSPVNIGVGSNTGIIPIWFNEGQHREFDDELTKVAKKGLPTEAELAKTKWGQIVANLGLSQYYVDPDTQAKSITATYISIQQHALHHTSKGDL
jgi:hypothetical protein